MYVPISLETLWVDLAAPYVDDRGFASFRASCLLAEYLYGILGFDLLLDPPLLKAGFVHAHTFGKSKLLFEAHNRGRQARER